MIDKDGASLTKGNRGFGGAQNAMQSGLIVSAIVFLSERLDEFSTLLSVTGIEPSELRDRVDDEAFQAGLLDYLVSNEPLLLAFCEETGNDPQKVAQLAAQHGGWG